MAEVFGSGGVFWASQLAWISRQGVLAHANSLHTAGVLQSAHTAPHTHSPSSCTLRLHGNHEAWSTDVRNKCQRKGRERGKDSKRRNIRNKETQKDFLLRRPPFSLAPPAWKI